MFRNEIIALHYAASPGRRLQHYPACMNPFVLSPTSTSTLPFTLKGVPTTEPYQPGHLGLTIAIHKPLSIFTVPGLTTA